MNGIGLFSFRFSSDFESPGPVGAVCNRDGKPKKENSKFRQSGNLFKTQVATEKIVAFKDNRIEKSRKSSPIQMLKKPPGKTPVGALIAVRCWVSRAQLAPTVRMTVGIR